MGQFEDAECMCACSTTHVNEERIHALASAAHVTRTVRRGGRDKKVQRKHEAGERRHRRAERSAPWWGSTSDIRRERYTRDIVSQLDNYFGRCSYFQR